MSSIFGYMSMQTKEVMVAQVGRSITNLPFAALRRINDIQKQLKLFSYDISSALKVQKASIH